jgi:hypothetical protein
MSLTLVIGGNAIQKTRGVFEVPFSDLSGLRFVDVPAPSTVEITELPGNADKYRLAVSAIHGGAPNSEDFCIFVHVTFSQKGNVGDPVAESACARKFRHIKRIFGNLVQPGIWDDGEGEERRTRTNGEWLCGVMYSRTFTSQENPVLADVIKPFVERFETLLKSPEILLFVCHASEDKSFVDDLAVYLDSRGVELWYDKREIKIGESIVTKINAGLESASHLVVVLSNASVTKPWVQRELSSTLMRQLQQKAIAVIPLLREDCAIPPLLADIKYADCRLTQLFGFKELVDDVLKS